MYSSKFFAGCGVKECGLMKCFVDGFRSCFFLEQGKDLFSFKSGLCMLVAVLLMIVCNFVGVGYFFLEEKVIRGLSSL